MVEQTQNQGGKALRTAMDLRMLAYFHGRERDLEQLTGLATAANLTVTSVYPVGFRSIVEMATPRETVHGSRSRP